MRVASAGLYVFIPIHLLAIGQCNHKTARDRLSNDRDPVCLATFATDMGEDGKVPRPFPGNSDQYFIRDVLVDDSDAIENRLIHRRASPSPARGSYLNCMIP